MQINYTGSAPDFSWVVHRLTVPEVEVAEIDNFDEIARLTAPSFILPERLACALPMPQPTTADMFDAAAEQRVEVLAQGTAGPYG